MADNKTGVVGGLISGVGALIVLVIVVLVIVSTLLGANLLRSTATTTTATEVNARLNDTNPYTLTGFSTTNRDYTIVQVINATDDVVITAGNYSFNSATGVIVNITSEAWDDVNITYTYVSPTNYETSSSNLGTNFTRGIDNVSGKIPTILLIGAVVLLFGVIVLLVRQSQIMGIGTGRSGSL